jgi:hypothetical protein
MGASTWLTRTVSAWLGHFAAKKAEALFGGVHEKSLARIVRARAGHRRHSDDCWSDAGQHGCAGDGPEVADAPTLAGAVTAPIAGTAEAP